MNVLVVAPHPDDETLGVGGTIKRLSSSGHNVTVLTVAAHMPPLYTAEIHERTLTEAKSAHSALGISESIFLDNPAVMLGEIPVVELNRMVADCVDRIAPQIMLVPFYDRHIDHRQVFEACMVGARPVGSGRGIQLIAAYETISETHWNAPHIEPTFAPNFFVDIAAQIDTKIAAISYYKSQLQAFPAPRSVEALKALAIFRGTQAGYAYAEAFQVIRMGADLFI